MWSHGWRRPPSGRPISRSSRPPSPRRSPVLTGALTLLRCGAAPEAVRDVVDRLDAAWPAWPDDPPTLARHVEAALLEVSGQPALQAYRSVLADPSYRPAFMVADAEQAVARLVLAGADGR